MDKLIHLILLSENLAGKGTVTQSTTYPNWLSGRSIDGIKYGSTAKSYCSAATKQISPWWRLDLMDVYDISTVIITARADGHLEQTRGADIRIGNSLINNRNDNPICAVTPDPLTNMIASYSCGEMLGRYVNVVMSGYTEYLTLCEVEVYGKAVDQRRRIFLRLKLSSSIDVAAESSRILQQLQSALALHISDFNLTWTQLPNKEKEKQKESSCV